MQEYVTMRTAASELGLRLRQVELAVQRGEVRAVCGAGRSGAVVPRAELDRLRTPQGAPQALRERLRLVGATRGAELLGITTARFARLARGGCVSPVQFYVNRYRSVVWLYLAEELRTFAERRPELLRGSAPPGLRLLLKEGTDMRGERWRERRVGELCRLAAGPWERAAARAAVLDEQTLRAAVPDLDEREKLLDLRPELVGVRGPAPTLREAAERLCVSASESETYWHRLMLDADLEEARSLVPVGVAARPREEAPAPDGAGEPRRAEGGGATPAGPRVLTSRAAAVTARPDRERPGAGAPTGVCVSGTGRLHAGAGRALAPAGGARALPPPTGHASGPLGPPSRHAGPVRRRVGRGWLRRGEGVSRPAS